MMIDQLMDPRHIGARTEKGDRGARRRIVFSPPGFDDPAASA
jgi:hypothetical protein